MPRPTEALVDQAALNYLNRFDSTVKNLRQVLGRQLRKRLERAEGGELEAASYQLLDELIDRVLERFQASGLLDEGRFAKNLAGQLRRRGASARVISLKLYRKGLSEEHVQAVFDEEREREQEHSAKLELNAAIAYARRRRLGHFRKTETSREQHQKDLAALARQGFSYGTAQAALGAPLADDGD